MKEEEDLSVGSCVGKEDDHKKCQCGAGNVVVMYWVTGKETKTKKSPYQPNLCRSCLIREDHKG